MFMLKSRWEADIAHADEMLEVQEPFTLSELHDVEVDDISEFTDQFGKQMRNPQIRIHKHS